MFFDEKGYLEVDTPLLSPDVIPESSISFFTAPFHNEFLGDRDLYLVPSPEVFMKKLISWGSGNIYQISRCFRNEEQLGSLHNPEFTMLEWYTVESDCMESLNVMNELLHALSPFDTRGICREKPEVMTVAQACWRYAGFDLEKTQEPRELIQTALTLGLSVPPDVHTDTWEEIFHRIFLTFVEPELPKDRPCFLTEYPKQIDCLAKDIPGTPWKERWELYLGGWELANCYSEETERSRVESFYRRGYERVKHICETKGRNMPHVDGSFPGLFHQDFPPCSGTALGVDRLIMTLAGQKKIQGVILFPLSDIL